jgi:hypothetical protein
MKSQKPVPQEKSFSQDLNSTDLGSIVQGQALAAPELSNEGGITEISKSAVSDATSGTQNLANSDRDATLARSVSEDERSDEVAAVRLEKRTNHNQSKYKITLTDYGNGLGEIGWSFIHAYQPNKAARGTSENREANQDRSVRRAKSRMRKLILSTNADHLLTLTYRNNMMDFNQACLDLTKFIRYVRKDLPDWIYIAVAEKQKRGAWHWHLAVRGRQDIPRLRQAWLKTVKDGNVDINPPKGKAQHRQLMLVRYLSKYLAKTFTDNDHGLNARRYRLSRGIAVPSKSIQLPENERNAVQFAIDTLQTKIGSVGHVWLAEDLAAGWACSWK